MDIGKRIKNDVLITYGSTKRCAEACNISRNTLIKMYECGVDGISHGSIAIVANALGYDAEQLQQGIKAPAKEDENETSVELAPVVAQGSFEEDLLKQFRSLSVKGQVKVLDYINDLKVVYPSEVNNG